MIQTDLNVCVYDGLHDGLQSTAWPLPTEGRTQTSCAAKREALRLPISRSKRAKGFEPSTFSLGS